MNKKRLRSLICLLLLPVLLLAACQRTAPPGPVPPGQSAVFYDGALVLDGGGTLYAGEAEEKFQRGDTWMIHGRATRISGKCKVLFVAI